MLTLDLYVSHQAPIEEVVSYTRGDNLLESEAYDKKKKIATYKIVIIQGKPNQLYSDQHYPG